MKRAFLLVAGLAAATIATAGEDAPLAPARLQRATVDSVSYAIKVTDSNLIGMTITNYGFMGNNFISRSPSFEYPLGAGYEHMVRGGLWVGATAQDELGGFEGVTTGALDGAQGSGSQNATEFTPAGKAVLARSSLITSDSYSLNAVSELDLLADFSDRPGGARSANNNENHRPLGIIVRQENYSWSFADYAHILFFHYRIVNDGPPLQNAWVGIYTELASGAKKDYTVWPPTATGNAILGGWYNKKMIQYDDSLRLFREHYCLSRPIPEQCFLERAPYWVGLKVLGWKRSQADTVLDKKMTLAAWSYAPGSRFRDQDVERYALISAGTIQPLDGDSLQPATGDPVSVLAVGPFSQIDPGDTISVDFAFVGGPEVFDIQDHARTAQRAFDRNYIVPVPPPSPRLKVVARHQALDLYWDDTPEAFRDPTSTIPFDFEGYRVYLGEDRLDLRRIAQYDKATAPNDTTGFNTGFAAVRRDTIIDGVPYQYRYTIRNLRDGFKYFVAVSAYDLGSAEIASLESGITQNKTLAVPGPAPGEKVGTDKVTVFPNPYRVEARWDAGQNVRDHYLWFTNLPERCTLKIFTLSGDLVYETNFDGATYRGQGTRGIYDPKRELDVDAPTMSGRSLSWNLITREGQAIATGIYMFAVENRATGDRQVGKFVVVKADQEDFHR